VAVVGGSKLLRVPWERRPSMIYIRRSIYLSLMLAAAISAKGANSGKLRIGAVRIDTWN
jgi:hypothetical protein